jgi:3-oxoacyl-[acyl-carrier-protein] synthase-3
LEEITVYNFFKLNACKLRADEDLMTNDLINALGGVLNMAEENIGVCGTGIYEPQEVRYLKNIKETEGISEEKLKKSKVKKLRVASEDEQPTDMAIEAAKSAIKDAGINGEEIDLVVYTQASLPDHLIWPDYAEIQTEIGALEANSFKIRQQCSGQLLAMDYVYSKMKADENIDSAIIVAAEKHNKPIINRWKTGRGNMFFGDGASALIMRRSAETNKMVDSYFSTDGKHNRLWQATYKGGTELPFSHQVGLEKGEMLVDFIRSKERYIEKSGYTEEDILNSMASQNIKVISKITNKLKREIDKLVTVNLFPAQNEKIADIISVNNGDTSNYIIEDYAHIGACDIAFNLHKMLKDNEIEKGDVVLLFSITVGYSVGGVLLTYLD